ncbi:MAG: MarR family transcriptional regulator [Bacteroidetes bacterium GWE2_29_8]|nr:MAG: MarR family transcriptional regulator [Bacteroidetes bacterium GWE2_29_8]OFY20766.1 MAG: MarR family transcriptional regulator [Bacteroidetes bacterium GWF2_29_10]
MENIEKVLNTMKSAAQPLSAGQIAELSGLDKKEVEKAMKQLKIEEKISSPKRCYWETIK